MTKSTTPGADAATSIKTWQERLTGVVTAGMMMQMQATHRAMSAEIADLRAVLAAGAPAEPLKLVLALPDYETRRIVVASDEVIDGERLVCVAIKGPDAATGAGSDTERLEFLMESEAWIALSKDGESCRLFHRSDDGEHMPMLGWGARHWSHDPRKAIDAAMQALTTPKEG